MKVSSMYLENIVYIWAHVKLESVTYIVNIYIKELYTINMISIHVDFTSDQNSSIALI